VLAASDSRARNGNERGNVRCHSSERCRLCADGVSRVNFFVNVNNYFFFFSRSRGESYIYCRVVDSAHEKGKRGKKSGLNPRP
jgi:hypothetical protein